MATVGFSRMRTGTGRGPGVFRVCSARQHAALEVTARHCRSELEQYGRCVAASPATWQQDCHQLKLSMARCASSHPIVQKIRHDCAEPFAAFEQCLKQNQASVVNCTEHVNEFLLCAEQVKLMT
ncbi:coiled-coil-helix-coiled-coil-helix domain-containing protein 5 isoform X1 [Emys orbicularis]|uniref:coiled-coil-helix-coiled-coil-helix domain-containing protein 5 isoform X1 n=1 Tax=Emys orbicularis TaxID=82168 RepID=UPI0031FDFEF9